MTGLEPVRHCCREILSLLCLPFHHTGKYLIILALHRKNVNHFGYLVHPVRHKMHGGEALECKLLPRCKFRWRIFLALRRLLQLRGRLSASDKGRAGRRQIRLYAARCARSYRARMRHRVRSVFRRPGLARRCVHTLTARRVRGSDGAARMPACKFCVQFGLC